MESAQSRPDLLAENELFRLFVNVNHVISFFLPLITFIFVIFSSNLMFFLFDYEFDAHQIGKIICISLIPILLNSILHFFVLSSLNASQITALDSNYAYHTTIFGLNLMDMNYLSYGSWFLFYLLFGMLIYDNSEHSIFSIICIVLGPSMLIVVIKFLMSYLS